MKMYFFQVNMGRKLAISKVSSIFRRNFPRDFITGFDMEEIS